MVGVEQLFGYYTEDVRYGEEELKARERRLFIHYMDRRSEHVSLHCRFSDYCGASSEA
jgi:hypothetical protein